MDQREFKNGLSEFEAPDADGGDVAKLLRALPRVDAPGNFMFRVKARIADGAAPQARLIPFLKLAAPLAIVLLVGAFVVFYNGLPSPNDIPGVIDTARTELTAPQSSADVTPLPSTTISRPQMNESLASQPERVSVTTERTGPVRRASNPLRDNRSRGGSIDSTLGSANTILPPGFQSVDPRKSDIAAANAGGADIAVRDVLQMLGVSADGDADGWRVRSAATNSMAQLAGVRVGDVIEAINGTPLKPNTTFKGGISVRTLRVLRDGKQVNLSLGN